MKKGAVIASTLTISTLTASYTLVKQFTRKTLYREFLDKDAQMDWYSELNGEKVGIKNHKGLSLQGYLFKEENAQQTVICLHALKKSAGSLNRTIPYLKELFPQSHILAYDANAHGLSDGYIRGFGYRDVLDLMYFITYILQKFGNDHQIILYGQGMGANTILNAAGLGKLKNVRLIISEGAYSQVSRYLGVLCQKEMRVSQYFCEPIIRRIIKDEIRYDIKKMDTVELVKNNEIPTVFVHSKNDKNVPFKMVFPLYNKNASEKFLFPIKQDHLYEFKNSTDSYILSLKEFIQSCCEDVKHDL